MHVAGLPATSEGVRYTSATSGVCGMCGVRVCVCVCGVWCVVCVCGCVVCGVV